MNGVISLGEAFIDFIPVDNKNMVFEKNAGGAPANVAVALSRLGSKVTFISKIGDDVLGRYLYDVLKKEGVNLNSLILTNEAKTGLSFVTLDKKGDRKFDFFGDNSADRLLNKDEIDEDIFEDYKIFHFGSISMINNISRKATLYALSIAENNNMVVSFDPNLRKSLWNDLENAKRVIKSVLGKVNILKVSREELLFLTGFKDLNNSIDQLKNKNIIDIILITDGANGVYLYKDELVHIPAEKVNVVDTTGAGDAFVAAFLNRLDQNDNNIEQIDKKSLIKYCKFANFCSAYVINKKGAMSNLPYREDVQSMFK
ncbi:MAG: carbohydrate kinase [Halanaerobiales bacterium]|nr:carbohydrate kinase [Halanaerobiales bacterium]